MTVKQISIFVENKEGRIKKAIDTLAKENINIRALSIADTTKYGIDLYGKSKLAGDSFVKDSGLQWTIVRPTLVISSPIGTGGIEFNMFVSYVKRFPVYFLPGGGRCLKRPVKREDLVKGIALAGLSENAVGKTYALAGKTILSMADMAKSVLKSAGKCHLMVPLPWWISKKLAVLKSWIGGRPVTAEQALAGFLYDAAPEIENATRDLGYNPGSPLE